MRIKKFFLGGTVIAALGLGITPLCVKAEDEGLYAMSLEALMNLEVVSASKRSESLSSAPAPTSVLTAEDIKKLGVQTLQEALGHLVGVITYDTYFGEMVALRNNFAIENFSTKVLFLVNGHPIYDSTNQGFNLNWIPLDAIERVEVVRGPSSVLYGTNALTGVVNVITKKDIGENVAQINLQAGSFDTSTVRATSAKDFGDWRYFISSTFTNSNGELMTVDPTQDEGGRGFSRRLSNQTRDIFATIGSGELELDLAYWDEEKPSKYGLSTSKLFDVVKRDNEGYYFDLRWNKEINEKLKSTVTLRYENELTVLDVNGMNFFDPLISPLHSRNEKDQQKYGVEALFDYAATSDLNIIVGALYDEYESDVYCNKQTTPPYACSSAIASYGSQEPDMDDVAIYANLDYSINDKLTFVGGVRDTENSLSGNNFDYRVGAIYAFSEKFSAKSFYGTSYRAPNQFETFVKSAVVLGNEDLEIETLDGFDLAFTYTDSNRILATVGYFYNETNDTINRRLTGRALQYFNSKGQEIHGAEWEFKYRPSKITSISLSGSHVLDTKDKDTNADIKYKIDNMADAMFTVYPTEAVSLTISAEYRSSWAAADSWITSNFAGYYTPQSYKNGTFFIAVNNMFDEEYDYAELVRQRIQTIPGGAGRNVIGGVELKF